MNTLILGASGATGKLLVEELLIMGQNVKIIVRSHAAIPESWKRNKLIAIIYGNISEMSVSEMATYLEDCEAVASCLGHNITIKGLFGQPRRLVTKSVALVCEAIQTTSPKNPIKFVLMNTVANSNRDLNEHVSIGERIVISLVRALLPPHSDNEQAAEYLRVNVGKSNSKIEWVAVRPDNLIDQDSVGHYELHLSRTRSGLFNPGKTSRINVGNFIARLVTDSELWNTWKGKMPVIYNSDSD